MTGNGDLHDDGQKRTSRAGSPLLAVEAASERVDSFVDEAYEMGVTAVSTSALEA